MFPEPTIPIFIFVVLPSLVFTSKLAHSAIGNDLRTQQERRVGAREKERRLGDLFWSPESFHRHLLPDIVRRLFEYLGRQAQPIEDRRGDRTGTDGVDPNAPTYKFSR